MALVMGGFEQIVDTAVELAPIGASPRDLISLVVLSARRAGFTYRQLQQELDMMGEYIDIDKIECSRFDGCSVRWIDSLAYKIANEVGGAAKSGN